MDIIHSAPTLELGAMKRSQLNSRFVWEILGLSTPILPIITILLILFKNNTQYPLIGEEKITVANAWLYYKISSQVPTSNT